MRTLDLTSSFAPVWSHRLPGGSTAQARLAADRLFWGILRAVIAFGFVSWVCAEPSTVSVPATPPALELSVAKAVFDHGPSAGKDPFFPKSTRHIGPPVNAMIVPELTLNGISGLPGKRLVMINNCTLEVGEEANVRVGQQTFKVRCVEIRDRSVVIQCNNQTKELALRKGL